MLCSSTKVIQQTHLSSPATFALLIAISNFLCTLIALRLIDRTGRRKLLLRGLSGMIIGMLVLSISFAFIRGTRATEDDEEDGEGGGAGGAAIMSLIGMTGFCCAYALSLGNVPWIVQSEVFVPELKALGTGLATSVNWAGNISVSSTFLHISQGQRINYFVDSEISAFDVADTVVTLRRYRTFGSFRTVCCNLRSGMGFHLLPPPWSVLFSRRHTYVYHQLMEDAFCSYPTETKGLSLEEVRSLFKNDKTSFGAIRHGGKSGDGDEETGLMGGGYYVLGNDDDQAGEEETEEPSEESDSSRTRRKGVV
jgi:uncharacterized membrane protein